MQIFTVIAAALAILAPASAYAQFSGFHGQATLANAVSGRTTVKVNNIDWACDGVACSAVSDRSPGLDGFMRECRKVVAAVGPLTGYSSQGRIMSPGNLVACNQASKEDGRVAQK